MTKIFYKILENGTDLYNLKKGTEDSAGFDLMAAIEEKITLKPSSTELIPAGFCLEMPKDFEAQVRPRSGLALKNSVTVLNSPGTIDADYRGEIIDEEALAEALLKKRIGGAGLDVFEHEPQITQKLFEAENVVLLPHISSATKESRVAMGDRVFKNIDYFLQGKKPPDLVKKKND